MYILYQVVQHAILYVDLFCLLQTFYITFWRTKPLQLHIQDGYPICESMEH